MQFHGKCHCGNISYSYDVPGDDDHLSVRICDCSFCQKHGGIYTSQADGALNAAIEDDGAVVRYRFGTETADFYICSRCGVMPFAISDIDGAAFAIVNINSLDDLRPDRILPTPVSFQGENLEDRLARRKRYWVGQVSIES
ncbi:MAG TPA: GFA family protein [Kiloniellaceae bacterium]|nr:GFA family protein [Kiloniellaceae bacterium]